jgi:serine/threonine-protein kinase HipA
VKGLICPTLLEVDYLLGVSDITRQGALRFAESKGGPFLAIGTQVPPLLQLPALLGAAVRISADGGNDDDLLLLLAPGSSLGGARPKAQPQWGCRPMKPNAWLRPSSMRN